MNEVSFSINQNYSNNIWILRGLAILSVVLGHYSQTMPFYLKLSQFHIPIFFFIGGIFIREVNNINMLIRYLYKRVSSLFIYIVINYVIIGIIGVYLGKALSIEGRFGKPFSHNIIQTIQYAFQENLHNNKLFLVAWFLIAYLSAFIISVIIIYIANNFFKKNKIKKYLLWLLVIISILCAQYYADLYRIEKIYYYNFYAQTLIATNYMLSGFLLRNYLFKLHSLWLGIIVFVGFYLVINIFNIKGLILSWSSFTLSGILMSYWMMFGLTMVVDSINKCYILKIVKNIGSYSKDIMSYHLLSFIVLDIIISKLSHGYFDLTKISALQHFYYQHNKISEVFTPLYLFVGILLPISIRYSYVYCKGIYKDLFLWITSK